MKKLILTVVFGLLTISLFGDSTQMVIDTVGMSEGIDSDTYISVDTFTKGVEWVFVFLVVITGYLSAYVPFLKNIDKSVYRVLAVAVVLGAGFYFTGTGNLMSLFFSYAAATSFYELLFKTLKRTPRPNEIKAKKQKQDG